MNSGIELGLSFFRPFIILFFTSILYLLYLNKIEKNFKNRESSKHPLLDIFTILALVPILFMEFSMFPYITVDVEEIDQTFDTYKISQNEVASSNANYLNQSSNGFTNFAIEKETGIEYIKIKNEDFNINASDTGESYIKHFKTKRYNVISKEMSPVRKFLLELINGFDLETRKDYLNDGERYEIYLNY